MRIQLFLEEFSSQSVLWHTGHFMVWPLPTYQAPTSFPSPPASTLCPVSYLNLLAVPESPACTYNFCTGHPSYFFCLATSSAALQGPQNDRPSRPGGSCCQPPSFCSPPRPPPIISLGSYCSRKGLGEPRGGAAVSRASPCPALRLVSLRPPAQ